MEKLKEVLVCPPILALPQSAGRMLLDIDAFIVKIGCVLQQKQMDDKTELIGYWSHSLTNAKERYETT